MRTKLQFDVPADFTDRLILWLETLDSGICFRGKGWQMHGTTYGGYGRLQSFSGEGGTEALIAFSEQIHDHVFVHLSYDVKNQLEALNTRHADSMGFPLWACFVPEVVFEIDEVRGTVTYHYHPAITEVNMLRRNHIAALGTSLQSAPMQCGEVLHGVDKATYLNDIGKLKEHILQGDVYQANYCIPFTWTNARLSSAALFNKGFAAMPNPFSAYYKCGEHALISFSPERFVNISPSSIITSQPMKGTAPRGRTKEEDEQYLQALRNSEKDRRENVMIVDMVRNDLSHYARRGSVQVPELYKIDTYKRMHQMHSTVTAELEPETPWMRAVLKAFPMGSMTGAPKVRAMQLLDELEHSCRGIYSGTVGFRTPEGMTDLNVVIRSLVYNRSKSLLSCHAGGGITDLSAPEAEYEECLVKVLPILEITR